MSWFGYLQPKSTGIVKTAHSDHAGSAYDWEVLGESGRRSSGGQSTATLGGSSEQEGEDVFVSDDEESSVIIEPASGANLKQQIVLLEKQLSVAEREKAAVEEEVMSMEAKIRALERSRQADDRLRSEVEEMREKAEKDKIELEEMSKEMEEIKKEVIFLRDEFRQVEDRARLEAEMLNATLEEAAAAGKKSGELEEKLKEAEEEEDRLLAQVQNLRETLETEKKRGDSLQEQLSALQMANSLLKSEAKDISEQNSRILGMLSSRSCGTPAASDPVEETEIVQKLRRLNEEIFETAAYISESFAFDGGVRKLDDLKEACTRARKALGSATLQKLVSIRHDEDPLLVQIACQSGMVECCRKIISSWGCDGSKADQFLPELFSRLKKSGMQSLISQLIEGN